MLIKRITLVWGMLTAFVCLIALLSTPAFARHGEVPNRIAEPAPYNLEETAFANHAPPFEDLWTNNSNDPGSCDGCHGRIFQEWNGSMMANAWRDPGWRGAFLLVARLTATDGCGDINENLQSPGVAIDGTVAYGCTDINPFAVDGSSSTFRMGLGGVEDDHPTTGSGSLMDDFCSRCHMPSNYVDAVPLAGVITDVVAAGSFEHGPVIPTFDPTSGAGTAEAYATVVDAAQSLYRNTETGQSGIFCEICHTNADSRRTPYSGYAKSGIDYIPATGRGHRDSILGTDGNLPAIPDATSPNLGYGIGAGAFRLSPHAIGKPERFGPVWAGASTVGTVDPYLSNVFDTNIGYQEDGSFGKHRGYYQVKFDRSEFCGACHDVTNPMTIMNQEGKWVGGFPIERTYTEWANSAYANRIDPLTGLVQANYDATLQRDCQTCHMQQHFGAPGTSQTLQPGGVSIAPLDGKACGAGAVREAFYTHHFVGGNSYIPNMIGENITAGGAVNPYPVLASASFTSANKGSKYHYAYFSTTDSGPASNVPRLAWDRLRNVIEMDISAPATANAGDTVNITTLTAQNTGSGHNFPTGFPEGRAAWVAVRAFDTGTGTELEIEDNVWNRTSTGVGYFTTTDDVVDPNFPGCNWLLPAGSPDPYAYTMKAVATLGNGCPTLALPYATPVNIVTNAAGEPIDSAGVAIDKDNPRGIPRYDDVDGDGDFFDDAFLTDTRLRPLPHTGSTVDLSGRYSVVIPANAVGPIAVSATVLYQSFEAIVAEEFLGNLANTDLDQESAAYLAGTGPLPIMEPCVLKGLCDGGRTPSTEPASVEGAPPVAMEVVNWVIDLVADNVAPTVTSQYPVPDATDVYTNVVAKVTFSEPVTGVDENSFTLVDSGQNQVLALVDQIGDGTWGLFIYTESVIADNQAPPSQLLTPNETYTLTLADVCDGAGQCIGQETVWSFTTTSDGGTGDTTIPIGFGVEVVDIPPTVTAVDPADQAIDIAVATNVDVTFSEEVTNVDINSFLLNEDGGVGNCSTIGASVTGTVTGNPGGDVWTLNPNADLTASTVYCVTVTTAVTDVDGTPDPLAQDFTSQFTTAGIVDEAPFVTNINPADGVSQVARNTTVVATFSESVDVNPTGFVLEEADKTNCAVTVGLVAGAVTGAGNEWTFTPNVDLAARTTYCVTITAAAVTDTDILDPPDNMEADFTSQFKTGNN